MVLESMGFFFYLIGTIMDSISDFRGGLVAISVVELGRGSVGVRCFPSMVGILLFGMLVVFFLWCKVAGLLPLPAVQGRLFFSFPVCQLLCFA